MAPTSTFRAGSREILPPIRVFVNPRFDPASPGVDECMALTTTHELGHAIGIFAHSPDEGDIMFSDPIVAELSARDRATAERAYHTEPTLTIGVALRLHPTAELGIFTPMTDQDHRRFPGRTSPS